MANNEQINEKKFKIRGYRISFCNRCHISLRAVFMAALFFALIATWGYAIVYKQVTGQYLQKSYNVEFGDEDNFAMGFKSGKYKLIQVDSGQFQEPSAFDKLYFKFSHVRYQLDTDIAVDRPPFFQYCDSNRPTWAFSEGGDSSEDACKHFIAESSAMDVGTFQAPNSDNMQWYSNADGKLVDRALYVRIKQHVVEAKDDFCDRLFMRLPRTEQEILGLKCGSSIIPTFSKLKSPSDDSPVNVNGCPVYISRSRIGAAVLLFTGRRWALMSYGEWNYSREKMNNTDFNDAEKEELARIVVDDLAKNLISYGAWFLDFGTEEDILSALPGSSAFKMAPTFFSEVVDKFSSFPTVRGNNPAGLFFYQAANYPPIDRCKYIRTDIGPDPILPHGEVLFECAESGKHKMVWSLSYSDRRLDDSDEEEDEDERVNNTDYVLDDAPPTPLPFILSLGNKCQPAVPEGKNCPPESTCVKRGPFGASQFCICCNNSDIIVPSGLGTGTPVCRPLNLGDVCFPTAGRLCPLGSVCARRGLYEEDYLCCKKTYTLPGWEDSPICTSYIKDRDPCPSTRDADCIDGLTCAQKSTKNATYICCRDTYIPFLRTADVCF